MKRSKSPVNPGVSSNEQMSFLERFDNGGVRKAPSESVVPAPSNEQATNNLILTIRGLRRLEPIVAGIRAAIAASESGALGDDPRSADEPHGTARSARRSNTAL